MKKLVFFFFSSLLVFGVTIFFRLGGHKPVQVEVKTHPDYVLIFKDHMGPYHKINDVIVSVENWASTNRIPCTQTFGEYLDNPRLVDERSLRSRGGCLLQGFSVESLSQSISASSGLQVQARPSKRAVIAQFSGAPSISPFKVYPKVEEFIKNMNLTSTGVVIEIYSFAGDREAQTEYIFELQ